METKTCNVCKHSKHLDQYYNNKKGKFGKGNTCKPCMLSLNKQTFEYTCPTCNKTSSLQRDPYRVAVKNNRECNSCAVKNGILTDMEKNKIEYLHQPVQIVGILKNINGKI
jgi:hypothetical protein